MIIDRKKFAEGQALSKLSPYLDRRLPSLRDAFIFTYYKCEEFIYLYWRWTSSYVL